MANRFVRTIRDVRDVDKTPLFTNEQNDLISDVNHHVYVRTGGDYVRITGLKDLEQQVDKIKTLIPKSEENLKYINELETSINKLKTDMDTIELKQNDDQDSFHQIQTDIKNINDKIQQLENINLNKYVTRGELKDIQATFESIKDIDFNTFAKKEDIPEIPDLSDYVKKEDMPQKPDLSDYVKKEDTKDWQKHKLTDDNGFAYTLIQPQLDDDETLLSLKPGYYYVYGADGIDESTRAGFLHVIINSREEVIRIIFYDYKSNEIFSNFYREKIGKFNGWELINPNIPDTSQFAKKSDIPELPDLSGYAKKEDIPEIPDVPDLSGYAKKEDIPEIPEIPEIPDLSDYVQKNEITDYQSSYYNVPDLKQDVDFNDIDNLLALPLGQHYVNSVKNITDEMSTNNGWITIMDREGSKESDYIRKIMFQPYSHARTFYAYIYKGELSDWEFLPNDADISNVFKKLTDMYNTLAKAINKNSDIINQLQK